MTSTIGRLRLALGLVLTVFVVGTIGFWAFGLGFIDSMYMTITTITTVGYRELNGPDISTAEKLFTMGIIVTGVSTVLYTFTSVVQTIVEGQLREFVGRRRMDNKIAEIPEGASVAGRSLRDADFRRRSGALVLALPCDDGTFTANPDPDIILHPRNVIVAVGTDDALQELEKACR